MVRTTITLPEEVHKGLKLLCVMKKKTAGQIITELLEWEIARQVAPEISEGDLDARLQEAREEYTYGRGIDARELLAGLINRKDHVDH